VDTNPSSNVEIFRKVDGFGTSTVAARNSHNNPRGIQIITDGAAGLSVAEARKLRDWLNAALPDETKAPSTTVLQEIARLADGLAVDHSETPMERLQAIFQLAKPRGAVEPRETSGGVEEERARYRTALEGLHTKLGAQWNIQRSELIEDIETALDSSPEEPEAVHSSLLGLTREQQTRLIEHLWEASEGCERCAVRFRNLRVSSPVETTVRQSTPAHRPILVHCPECGRDHPECAKPRGQCCFYDCPDVRQFALAHDDPDLFSSTALPEKVSDLDTTHERAGVHKNGDPL
jgi:hypothetical protein